MTFALCLLSATVSFFRWFRGPFFCGVCYSVIGVKIDAMKLQKNSCFRSLATRRNARLISKSLSKTLRELLPTASVHKCRRVADILENYLKKSFSIFSCVSGCQWDCNKEFGKSVEAKKSIVVDQWLKWTNRSSLHSIFRKKLIRWDCLQVKFYITFSALFPVLNVRKKV